MNKLLTLLGISLFLSCGQASEKAPEQNAVNVEPPANSTQQQTEAPVLVSTTDAASVIKNMQALLDGFTGTNDAAAFTKLHDELYKEFDPFVKSILNSPNKEGKLHDFMVPISVMIEWVGAPDMETKKKGVASMKEYLPHYFEYFK